MDTNSASLPALTDGGPKIRLGIMMFLQYAVWGIWLPFLAIYLVAGVDEGGLGFTGSDVGWILGVAAASGARLLAVDARRAPSLLRRGRRE